MLYLLRGTGFKRLPQDTEQRWGPWSRSSWVPSACRSHATLQHSRINVKEGVEQLRQTRVVHTLHKCSGVASWLDGAQCRLSNGHLLAIVWRGQMAMQPDDRHIVRSPAVLISKGR